MTQTLERAVLIRLTRLQGQGPNGEPRVAPDTRGAFPVQFNPTSLKITQQNNVDAGGATTQTQRRQNPSTESATLAFDLEFDTAEDTGPDGPADVRTRTAIIRQFAGPAADAPSEPPPLLKFAWGTFSFLGIVTSLTEELDYFSPSGRPLRAKVSVTMKELRLDLEAKKAGAGARTGQNATPPGTPNPSGGAPGSAPASNPDTAALAKLGESLQQLLARMNADPATWRSAMAGLSSPLSLGAGAQVQLSAGASASAGLGVTAGFAAGASAGAGIGASAGLRAGGAAGATAGFTAGASAGAGATAGFSAGAAAGATANFSASAGATAGFSTSASATAGFQLAENGGVAATARATATAQANASVAAARASFETPALTAQAEVRVGPGLPPLPPPDPRASSYGQGIPLRPRLVIDARATGR